MNKIIVFILIIVYTFSACKKGYITPEHVQPQVTSNVVQVINIANLEYANLYFNGLLVNTGSFTPGLIDPRKFYSLPAVNGQTFELKVVFYNTILDTTLTASADGLDAYYIYKDSSKHTYGIYTLHTSKQSPPGKGNIKIRFANLYPNLPGSGSVKIQLSRKENHVINDDKPLGFGDVTPYIEVPFGEYQPLLMNELNKPILDSQDLGANSSGTLYTWSQINLLPGGVYTFILAPVYDPSGVTINISRSSQLKQDAFFKQEAVAKVLFVHTNPLIDDIKIKIDGAPDYASPLSYGNSQIPFALSEGTHEVEIDDTYGNILVQKQITVFDKERDALFFVDNDAGKPDLLFFNLAQPDSHSTVVSFFNFSPDAPPVTFLSEHYPNSGGLYVPGTNTILFDDTLSTNIPYLRIPKLSGKQTAPQIPGSDYLHNTTYLAFNNGYYNSIMTPPKLKIAFKVTAYYVVNDADVLQSVYIDNPFNEFPSFARYDVAQQNFYEGDAGYFLVMLIGERYPKNPLRGLQIKSIKYVD